MPNLLIVSHCPSPNVQALADAVAEGAAHADCTGVALRSLAALQAETADVLWCDAILLGTTENFGYMAGALKDFFERVYYPCLDATQGLPYGLFVKAGQDGSGARQSVERIVTGLKWRPVMAPLLMVGDFRDEWLDACREAGMTMAAGLEAGIF